MNRVDSLAAIDLLNDLLKRAQNFRVYHRIGEAAFWDLMNIYWYHLECGKGMSTYQICKARYGRNTGDQAIKMRRQTLIARGLVFHTAGRTFLTSQGLSEIKALLSIIPPSIARSVRERSNAVHKEKAA